MKYLICVDGSHHSKVAFDKILSLTTPEDEFVIVTATEYISDILGPRGLVKDMSSLRNEVWEKIKKMQESYESVAKSRGYENVSSRVCVGENPKEEICSLANNLEEKFDLIVCGSRGLTALDRVIVGSTSSFILNHVHCGVLMVK